MGRLEWTLMKLDSIFAVSCGLTHQGLQGRLVATKQSSLAHGVRLSHSREVLLGCGVDSGAGGAQQEGVKHCSHTLLSSWPSYQ